MQLLKAIKWKQRLSFFLYSAWMAGLSIANKPTFKSIVPWFLICFSAMGLRARKLYYTFPHMTLASRGAWVGRTVLRMVQQVTPNFGFDKTFIAFTEHYPAESVSQATAEDFGGESSLLQNKTMGRLC